MKLKMEVMEIKVLGAGCVKCDAAYELIQKVVAANALEVKLVKVEDVMELLNYNVLSTPAIVVDGVVRFKGRVPSEREIKEMLGLKQG